MRMTFAYDLGNGVEHVEVGPMAIIGYETDNRTKISRLAAEGFGITDMTDLAWRQLRLENRTGLDLDGFRGALRDIDPVVDTDPM
jgi:hypothetical protein